MGVDLSMFAVPLDSEPMKLIRSDEAVWWRAYEHRPFTWRTHGQPFEVIDQLKALVPDLEELTFENDSRTFEQAAYALDPATHRHMTWAERAVEMPHRIVHGDEVFAEHARGGQGRPWRCSSNDFLTMALVYLAEFDPVVARAAFSVEEMSKRAVYKAFSGTDDDERFASLVAWLGDLNRYYQRIWERGLGVIVVVD